MKKLLFAFLILFVACKGNDKYILNESIGKVNKVLVVTTLNDWESEIGNTIRNTFGELQVGLPQPEPTLQVSQVAPNGFGSMMKSHRNVLVIEQSSEKKIEIKQNVYAQPQVIIYLKGNNKQEIIELFEENKEQIINMYVDADVKFMQKVFRKEKLDESKYLTTKNLGLSLVIPNKFKTVEDTGEFLWLRNHLTSGIAKTGSNNILIYSLPYMYKNKIADKISSIRDSIGQIYIPGSQEGMYMITEEAYTPYTFDAKIDGKKAYETRGKWEVKNDFMAGPFINYVVVDDAKKRLIVVEGFTYAPAVEKKAFVFELEAIAKSLNIAD